MPASPDVDGRDVRRGVVAQQRQHVAPAAAPYFQDPEGLVGLGQHGELEQEEAPLLEEAPAPVLHPVEQLPRLAPGRGGCILPQCRAVLLLGQELLVLAGEQGCGALLELVPGKVPVVILDGRRAGRIRHVGHDLISMRS